VAGLPRAIPGETVSLVNTLDSLSGLTPCPASLRSFLATRAPWMGLE
jgi:hypothetical protein